MILRAQFILCFILGSRIASAVDEASNKVLGEGTNSEDTVGFLRGGRFGNGKKVLIPPQDANIEDAFENIRTLSFNGEDLSAMPNGEQPIISNVTHVMIPCQREETELSCKKRIMDAIPQDSKDRLRFTNYLSLPNVHAAEVRGSTSILDRLDGVVEDPPRETMHIKDSVQVHRSLQWGQSIPWGIESVKAREAWTQHKTKGENIRVCVMDTGVNRDHPDFDSGQLFGYDGDELVKPWWRDIDGHGTHVTGTIAASDNNQGVVGVAPGAEIFTARVFSTNGKFFSSNIIAALQVCKDGGAKVISMSLGGPSSVGYEQQAYKDLHEKFGIVTVAAAGNTGGYNFLYPAAYGNVISVASINWNRERSSFSTRNQMVDVAAPGSSILSTWENGAYATSSGTSMACPHVSGVVALMLSANPSATPTQVFSALTSSSENPNTSGRDNDLGHGIVDAVAAIEAIKNLSNDNKSDEESSSGSDSNSNNNNNNNNNSNNSGSGNSSGTGNSNSDCVELVVTLKTDRYGTDTTHWLQEGSNYIFYDNTFSSFRTYQETACINPNVCSTYNIRDDFGDGISGEGVEIKYGGEVVYSGGDFGVGGIKYLGNC